MKKQEQSSAFSILETISNSIPLCVNMCTDTPMLCMQYTNILCCPKPRLCERSSGLMLMRFMPSRNLLLRVASLYIQGHE